MATVKLTTKQVASLVNAATQQFLGETAVLTEDLQNAVDIGTSLENVTGWPENFVSGLSARIGNEILVNRPYKSSLPNLYRTQTEYGQITMKMRGKLDDAQNNQSWELTDDTSYDDNVFIESTVDIELFTKATAYEIRKSITDDQIRGAFTNPQSLMNFTSMLFTMVYNSIEVKRQTLNQMVICNAIGETIANNNAVRYVKLVTLYNAIFTADTVTAATALYNVNFLKYAGAIIRKYQRLLERYSTLYNLKAADTFTPKEMQHLILHSDFADNTATFLESDTFNKEFVELPYHDVVPYWQGTGTDLSGTRTINITTASGSSVSNANVIGVLFDHDAMGIFEDSVRTNVKYINSADFTNYWFKQKAKYFNSTSENIVVFTLD